MDSNHNPNIPLGPPQLGLFGFMKKYLNNNVSFSYIQSLIEAFKIFDKNKNGYIEAKELRQVTTTLGSQLSEEEFNEFWKEADVNHDGKLDYEEFIKIMAQY